ncbi:sigma-70 family RNA polymerase sigma factor [Paenibacillus tepidiphilus]|uniref:sigma-70 family RNA polymerase sigma factor n=1 Tax=Paenibacillus tepidiphilus TaxID=2608683 RepID=UPI0012397FB0|nr:sigma-70 family RNA polymerase sigma factor [Paenibacillus tepidiphilus]
MELTILAAKAAKGDPEAFIAAVRQLENSLHYMAKSLVSRDEDVADALQETILKAYKAVTSLREPKYFKTWIFRILINECHNILAERSGSVSLEEAPPLAVSADDYGRVDLREAVDRLEESQRITVILHYFEDLPLRQVAQALNISESAVKMRLMRARDTLQRTIGNYHEGKMNYGRI